MASATIRGAIIATAVLAFCAACAGGETPGAGLAETNAGSATDVPGSTGASTGSETTAAAGIDATTSSDSAADGGGAATAASGVIETVATEIVLTSANNEMNTQPDDEEWGLLTVSGAYTTSSVGEFAGSNGTKLMVVDIEVVPVNDGNVFAEAFRLRADDQWYNPINRLNVTSRIGGAINHSLVFEVPQSVGSAVLEAGLPEELGVGRLASYALTFEPGEPDSPPLRTDEEVLALAGSAKQTSAGNEFNLQPDDKEWGMLTVTGVRTALIEGDYNATLETMLVVLDFDIVVGEGGNFFHQTFRLRADDEWYPPVTRINETTSAGEVFSGSVFFEVPRTATTFALEAGMPEILTDYQWNFPVRTATFEVVLQ